jgi:hypothetical protein
LSCLVLSCLVLSCLVLSCLVLSCLVLLCVLVVRCLVLSCLVRWDSFHGGGDWLFFLMQNKQWHITSSLSMCRRSGSPTLSVLTVSIRYIQLSLSLSLNNETSFNFLRNGETSFNFLRWSHRMLSSIDQSESGKERKKEKKKNVRKKRRKKEGRGKGGKHTA